MIPKDAVLNNVQRALRDHQLDALVAVSPWNVAYTSGTSFSTQTSIPDRLALVVATPDQEPTFIYCTIEEGSAKGHSFLRDFRGYTEFADNPAEVLADVLRERGVGDGRIGIEKRFLVVSYYEDLTRALPSASFVEADSVFDRLRMIKTPEEIRLIADAALATDTAIRIAFESARVGDSEKAVAARMISEAEARGADKIRHMNIATGTHGFEIHARPGLTEIQPSDVLRTDFGMYWGQYHSDIARTAFAAPLLPQQAELYKIVEDAHQTVIAAMRPGVRASDLYRLCLETLASHGVTDKLPPHIGHSIGLGGHENPMISPFHHTELEPGMTIMIEPAIVGPDGIYHTEDLIEITANGHSVHSRSADWSQPLVVS